LLSIVVWLSSPAIATAAGVILGSEHEPDAKETIDAARQSAPEFSFADIESADAPEQLRHADVILAVGARALTMARTVAPDRPTVYTLVPVAEALPGRAVTGVALEVPPFSLFSQWKQIRFDGLRVGVVYDPKTSAASLADAGKAAGALGLTLVTRQVSDASQVRKALDDLAPQIDVLWLVPDRRLYSDAGVKIAIDFALQKKIALLGFSDAITAAGALVSLAPDGKDIGRRAARIALGIAGRPADQRLPVPPPATSPGALTVNAKTAQLIGLDIPESLLHKARKIFH
jgi:putative tryptophan/tyrosine transport system substrate-binding protein